nr:retrovirus-related Pol polyprotein from transposon TNT 1-94 [Tanacetum cinerariifolium]
MVVSSADYLVDFEEYDGGNILLGDGRECRVRGTGKVQVQMRDGSSFVLDNVRYVSELRRKLISLGTLEKEGFTVKMQSGKIKVIKGQMVVLSGTRRADCVYTLDGYVVTRKTLKGRKQLREQQTEWKMKTGNVLDFCNQRSTQQCTKSGVAKHLGVAVIQQQNGLVKETNMTLLAKLLVRCKAEIWPTKSLLDKAKGNVLGIKIVRDQSVAQRRLKDKQPEENTNTDCLVKEQEKEYQNGWKIKTGNVLDSCNQRSTQQRMKSEVAKHLGAAGIQQQNRLVYETNVTLFAKVRCFLIQSGLSKVFWAEDTTRSTYLVNRSPSSVIGSKKRIDMLEFFGWLASIKQGMLEPVKVKCIF